MQDSRRLSLIVGTFFIASLVALAVAVLSLTSESGLFARQYRIYGNFDNVQGLLSGAPVWMAGKEVGRVHAVEFTEHATDDEADCHYLHGDIVGDTEQRAGQRYQ